MNDHDSEQSQFAEQVKALFGGGEPEPPDGSEETDLLAGNVVPKEGRILPRPTDPDAELRQFSADLFYH